MERDWAVLNIDDARMWATLSIKEPEGEESTQFTPKFIMDYLRGNGIEKGIQVEAIQALCHYVRYGKEIIVAKGEPAVNGIDGCYNFAVPLEDEKKKPVINKDGSVDYYNSLRIAMVNEGDIIAVYEPPTDGYPGFTIFGEILEPVKGHTLRPLAGKGFSISEDKREYRAKIGGRIFKQNDRIIIEALYIIHGDLDMDTGNVIFNGDVEVKGDVRSGLSLEASGSVFIHGHVGACTIKADKDITISRGIQGRDKAMITAGNNVTCSFIERSIITCGGNVYADSILDSHVTSRKEVIVNDRKGLIIGGNVQALQGISVKDAGTSKCYLTVLGVGPNSEYAEKIIKLKEEKKKSQVEVELLEKHLKDFDKLDGSKMNKQLEELRMKIIRAKVVKAADLKQCTDELNILSGELENAKAQARICIKGLCHPEVKVCIGNDSITVNETYKDIIIMKKALEIVIVANDE